MAWEKLPQWKDENPVTHGKQQLTTKINKLKRKINCLAYEGIDTKREKEKLKEMENDHKLGIYWREWK